MLRMESRSRQVQYVRCSLKMNCGRDLCPRFPLYPLNADKDAFIYEKHIRHSGRRYGIADEGALDSAKHTRYQGRAFEDELYGHFRPPFRHSSRPARNQTMQC